MTILLSNNSPTKDLGLKRTLFDFIKQENNNDEKDKDNENINKKLKVQHDNAHSLLIKSLALSPAKPKLKQSKIQLTKNTSSSSNNTNTPIKFNLNVDNNEKSNNNNKKNNDKKEINNNVELSTQSTILDSLITTPKKTKILSGLSKEWDWKEASLKTFTVSPLNFFDTKVGSGDYQSSSTPKKQKKQQLYIKDEKEELEQSFINTGPKIFGQTVCPKCKMLYFKGSDEDEKTHNKHCIESTQVQKIIIKNWKSFKLLNSFSNDEGIIMLTNDDDENTTIKNKLEAIKKMVNQELGYQEVSLVQQQVNKSEQIDEDEEEEPTEEKYFIYLNSDGRVVGFLAAENINKGFRIKKNEDSQDHTIQCDKDSIPVRCGINRIWTLKSSQRQGIATKLMDSVRRNMFYRSFIEKDQIATTTPSTSGQKFFENYFSTSYFPLYRLKH